MQKASAKLHWNSLKLSCFFPTGSIQASRLLRLIQFLVKLASRQARPMELFKATVAQQPTLEPRPILLHMGLWVVVSHPKLFTPVF